MTVETNVSKASFNGSGSAGPFTFNFRFFTNNQIYVIKTDADGIETVLTETTDYALTGTGLYAGGAVTLVSVLAVGETLTVYRIIDLKQETSIRNQGAFFAELHEDTFDKIVMMVQQVNTDVEELTDKALSADTVGGNYNALMRQIENVGDVIKATDAVNYQSLTTEVMRVAMSIATGQIAGVLARGYASLNAAVNAIGANETTLFVDAATVLTGACTIPGNVNVVVAQSGLIDTAGYGLIINGPFTCSLNQAFSGAGQVVFGAGSVLEIYPNWWKGTETDESVSINKAIKCSVQDGSGCATVKLEARPYSIDNPIEIWKWNGTIFSYFVLTLKCNSSAFAELAPACYITATYKDRPAIMFQKARGLTIENISLKGQCSLTPFASLAAIVTLSTDWTDGGTIRTDRYSPYSGVCGDPFGTSVPTGGGYAGYETYQTAGNNATGSSSVELHKVHVDRFHVGFMITPNANTQNAENIYLNQCTVLYSKYQIAIGQDQSRQVVVRDFSGYAAYTSFDGITFGKQRGNSPMVYCANIGLVRNIYNQGSWMHGQECMTNIYAEDFYAINTVGSTPIVNSNFAFDSSMPNRASLISRGGFFDNCTFWGNASNLLAPMVFPSNTVFNSCTFNEFPIYDVGTMTKLTNCVVTGQYGAGFMWHSQSAVTGINLGNLNKLALLPWTEYSPPDSAATANDKVIVPTYIPFRALGVQVITPNVSTGTASFTMADAATASLLRVGDYIIWPSVGGNDGATYANGYTMQFMGEVSSVVGALVSLIKIPITVMTAPAGTATEKAFETGSYSIAVFRFKKYHPPTTGDFVAGSPTVTNVSVPTGWQVGDAVSTIAGYAVAGTWITNIASTTFTLSTNSGSTLAGVSMFDLVVQQESSRTAAPTSGYWIAGSVVKKSNPSVGQPTGWICTVGGSPGTWVAQANL